MISAKEHINIGTYTLIKLISIRPHYDSNESTFVQPHIRIYSYITLTNHATLLPCFTVSTIYTLVQHHNVSYKILELCLQQLYCNTVYLSNVVFMLCLVVL